MICDEEVQRFGRRIRQRKHAAPAQPGRLPDLDRDAGQHLLAPGSATCQPRLITADVCLIHFDHPSQSVPTRAHQHRPQPLQHCPRRLVGTNLERPLEAQRRDPVFAGGEQPAGGEPDRERRAGPVKDRARSHRRAVAAPGAPDAPVASPPGAIVATVRAGEASGPSQPRQVVQAVCIGSEPGLELAHRPRIMRACTRAIHHPSLHRSG